MKKSTVKRKCRSFAKKAGVGLRFTSDSIEHTYWGDGVIVIQDNVPPNLLVERVTHEIAHWVVATATERKKIDFGIGFGPFGDCSGGGYGDPPCPCQKMKRMPSRRADQVEASSSLIGILITLHLFGWDLAYKILYDHNWSLDQLPSAMKEKRTKQAFKSLQEATGTSLGLKRSLGSVIFGL